MLQPKQRAQLYRRILCSKNFKVEGKAFHKKSVKERSLPIFAGGYTSCRLILLDKNPGIRPISVGVVLRRIVGKTNARFLKEEIKEAAGPIQVCAGHSAGSETAIDAMSQVFVEEGDRTEFKAR